MNFIVIPIIILIGVVIIISIIPNKKKIKINSDKLGLLANEEKEVLEEVKNLKVFGITQKMNHYLQKTLMKNYTLSIQTQLMTNYLFKDYPHLQECQYTMC